ncbi:hypothetical protein ACGFIF_33895 [Kribbella sp. NPDC049174]|uniref:hypothetical protein n=1 Tax=Kribbella sp. NPDC049174 TaxID=3364112 RepID=UPI00371C922D
MDPPLHPHDVLRPATEIDSESLPAIRAGLASLAVLRYAGVHISDPHDGSINSLSPVESGSGEQVTDNFRWEWVLELL